MPEPKDHSLKTDLPLKIILLLALLAIPYFVVHSLQLADFDSLLYQALIIIPFVIWIAVATIRKTSRPVVDFTVLGFIFGLLLTASHQLLWNIAMAGDSFDPSLQELMFRVAAGVSHLATGTILGLAVGMISLISMRIRGIDKKQ